MLGPITIGNAQATLRRQSRMLLGWLALQRGERLSVDRLTRLIWSEPPASARRQIQTIVRLDLRQVVWFDGDRVRLDRSAIDLDEDRFMELAADESRPDRLKQALDLWRGPRPYLEIADHPDALAAVHDLETRRLRVVVRLYRARMQRGEVPGVVSELAAELMVMPEAADLRRLHAIALALSGRRIEALRELQLVLHAVGRADPWTVDADRAVHIDDEARLRQLIDDLDL